VRTELYILVTRLFEAGMAKYPIEYLNNSKSAECERILRALPEWFGIESALLKYCEEVKDLPVLVARNESGSVTGLLSIIHRKGMASEIHVMGVLPDYHRQGIGRMLIEAAAESARGEDASLLAVKTLGPSHPKPGGYTGTKNFYERLGFLCVEEFSSLWPDMPCLLLVKVL